MCVFMLSLRPFGLWPARLFFMEFSRQEYRSGLPFPSPGNFPDPRIKPASLESRALVGDSLPLNHLGSPRRRGDGGQKVQSFSDKINKSWGDDF